MRCVGMSILLIVGIKEVREMKFGGAYFVANGPQDVGVRIRFEEGEKEWPYTLNFGEYKSVTIHLTEAALVAFKNNFTEEYERVRRGKNGKENSDSRD